MRSLLTGIACAFNRRYGRVGHLFQNRYKSILCEEDSYLTTLVRYIHRNPLRRGIVSSLEELDTYPYTGHSGLMGTQHRPWQAIQEVLSLFSEDLEEARRGYRNFVANGADSQEAEQLKGRGVTWTRDGWKVLSEITRGREQFVTNERILGGEDFVRSLLSQRSEEGWPETNRGRQPTIEPLIDAVCSQAKITRETLLGSGRCAAASKARQGLSFLWLERLGGSGRALARELGISPVAVYRAAGRGRREAHHWLPILRAVKDRG